MSQITFPEPALRAVFFDGPEPDRNHDGDEIPTWSVCTRNITRKG